MIEKKVDFDFKLYQAAFALCFALRDWKLNFNPKIQKI